MQPRYGVNVLAAVAALGIAQPASAVPQPTRIRCGGSESRQINPLGEVDTFAITLEAGQNVIIDVDANSIGSSLDATVGFFDTDGTTLLGLSNDYFPPGMGSTLDPFLVGAATVDGTYFIKMTADADNDFNGTGAGSTGPYVLKVECVDADPNRQSNDTYSTATPIVCDAVLKDYYLGDNDVDFYAIPLLAGATITIDLDRLENTLDAQVALYAPDGTTQLAMNDDEVPNALPLDPYLSYTVGSAGTYYVAVGSYDDDDFNGGTDSGSSGRYDLFVNASPCEEHRVSASNKGSLLMYSKVELRWAAGAAGALIQDTILELTNDYPDDVCVQLYFVNGDEPRDPVIDPVTGGVIVEGEPGWEWVDCQFCLTPDQPTYWSAATGLPAGCQPFSVLDPSTGMGPGRPDPTNPAERHLRGFVYAWAVDQEGYAIHWNHLSGGATLVNYANSDAWDYNAWAFQAHEECEKRCIYEPGQTGENCEGGEWAVECEPVEHGARIGYPGRIRMDGTQYDFGFDMLLMDFIASGSTALSAGGAVVTSDTDLTLHPITTDLRQDSIGPVTTKAEFAIWNEDERRFSGTTHCITCWDQTLLSLYGNPNHFLMANLQADKGKARIDGVESIVCDVNCVREENNHRGLDIEFILDILGIDHVCSYDASLLGVVAKAMSFSGSATGRATAGRNLVGMGVEEGWIKWDIIAPPGSAYQGMEGMRSDRQIVKSPATVRSGRADTAQPVDSVEIPAE